MENKKNGLESNWSVLKMGEPGGPVHVVDKSVNPPRAVAVLHGEYAKVNAQRVVALNHLVQGCHLGLNMARAWKQNTLIKAFTEALELAGEDINAGL